MPHHITNTRIETNPRMQKNYHGCNRSLVNLSVGVVKTNNRDTVDLGTLRRQTTLNRQSFDAANTWHTSTGINDDRGAKRDKLSSARSLNSLSQGETSHVKSKIAMRQLC